eukprot:scaffold26753_cov215-Skeletonema_menzelii.AAC.1
MSSQASQPNEEDTPGGFQVICCPIQYARSASDVKPLPPSTTPLAIEERVPSNISKGGSVIGLFRTQSRAASTIGGEQGPDADADAGADAGQVDTGVALQPSRSVISRISISQGSLEKPQSMNEIQSRSFASVQGHSIHAGEGDIDVAAIPYGYYEGQARQSRRRGCKNGVIIASVCVFVGLCAGLIVLSARTQTSQVAKSMNRYEYTRDSDGDGIGDELEKELGLNWTNYDTDGDGTNDGDELRLVIAETGAIAQMMMMPGGAPKSPKAPSAPKSPKAPSAPKSPKAPSAPKSPKAPSAPKSPKAPSAPKSPKAPSAPKSPKAPSAPKSPKAPSAPTSAPNVD